MTTPEIRQVTDSKVLAALAHPLRRRLMDALKVDGPSTVGQLADRTGQAVGNVSHHLRVLAGCELVEEAPELARDRRERWWRLVSTGVRWSTSDFGDDPASLAVAHAARSLNLDHHLGTVRAWYASEEDRPEWAGAAFSTDKWLILSPAELAELERQLSGLLAEWGNRRIPDDGQHRESVFLFAYGVPAQP